MNNLQNNLPILWWGDLQIAPRDNGFPVGSEDPPTTEWTRIVNYLKLFYDLLQAL